MKHHFECTKCNKEMVRKDFYLSTVFYCESCFDYKITERECDHDFILIFFELSNGSEQLRKYCKKCHYREPKPLSQKDIDPNKYLHKKNESYEKKMAEFRKTEQQELRPFVLKFQEKQQELYFSNYNKYINSEEWKEKRDDIMDRDDNTCQICGRTAENVHHLTYAHFKNEYDFELVSLCRECHYDHYHNPDIKKKILNLNIPENFNKFKELTK